MRTLAVIAVRYGVAWRPNIFMTCLRLVEARGVPGSMPHLPRAVTWADALAPTTLSVKG